MMSVTTGTLFPLGPRLKDLTTYVVPEASSTVGTSGTTVVGTIGPHTMWTPITIPSGKVWREDD